MGKILYNKDIIFLYSLLAIVYLTGLFIPLMENDSAQHATMAMRMYIENDFINIIKGNTPYLDKPHLHFWLAALSFKIFGIKVWAYRIPALLFTILGAFSACKLAKEFYGNRAIHLASLIFLSSQAIILSNHDVRTDAVLTGCVIFSIWQLVLYFNYNNLKNAIFAGVGMGLAFSTKGLLGVVFILLSLFVYVIHSKKWHLVYSWKVLIGLLIMVLTMSPMLYAYYQQFGKTGIQFILWDQSFNRLNAKGFGETSPDYLFFFHTLLWAFLPWAVIAYTAIGTKIKHLITSKYKFTNAKEILSSVGFLIIMLIISTSKFKLPHYINGLLPILSVLVSGYIVSLHRKKKLKALKNWNIFQTSILILAFALVTSICYFSFNTPPIHLSLLYISTLISCIYWLTRKLNFTRRLMLTSVSMMALINIILNTHFYPELLNYQPGVHLKELAIKKNINPKSIKIIEDFDPWSFEFSNEKNYDRYSISELKKGDLVFVNKRNIRKLKANNITWSKIIELDKYRITRLSAKFLNPHKRDEVLEKAYIIRIN